MRITGTVLVDPETVLEDASVVTEGDEIAFVGDAVTARERYQDHDERSYDIVAPGLVGAHVHSVQSLGRGIADDAPLLEWLTAHVLPMEASLTRHETKIAATLGYIECLESGTTTVVDHLTVDHADAAFEAARDIGIRGVLGKVLMDREAPPGLQESAEAGLRSSERLIEEYHGAADDRLRYAVTPRFAISCTEACLRGAADLADDHDGVVLHTHASETQAEVEQIREETGMRNVEWLHEVGCTGPESIFAHCVWTDEDERDVLAETDTTVAHCPSANMKLASGVAPIADYLDRGIEVAIGNDGPPCNNTLDPLTELRQASLLASVDALDATTLPAPTVLRMATTAGARATGFDRIGALRQGYRADVVGLTTDRARATPVHDVRSHLVYAAHGDDVVFTMVDGRVVQDAGEVQTVDADAIEAEARRLARQF